MYGDIPPEQLLPMVGEEPLDEGLRRLWLHRMQNLVATLGEVVGIEGEGGAFRLRRARLRC